MTPTGRAPDRASRHCPSAAPMSAAFRAPRRRRANSRAPGLPSSRFTILRGRIVQAPHQNQARVMAQRKKTLRRKASTARGKARKAAKPPRRKAGKRAAAKPPTPRKRRTKAPRKPTTARKVTRKTAKPTRTPRPPAAQGVPAPAAQSRAPLDLDQALSKPIEAGLIPGVVALAADDRGIFYKAAFGMR
jgi:hypothetical protein